MVPIYLTQGKIAYVDADDYAKVMFMTFTLFKTKNTNYAKAGTGEYLHRIVMGLVENDGLKVDHVDGNGLNCVRSNMRICTNQQNNQNRRSEYTYKGIYWIPVKEGIKWCARIKHNTITIHLGTYDTEIEAAQAYDKKALELFGVFANLNFKVKNGEA